jgi:hypothetical protein
MTENEALAYLADANRAGPPAENTVLVSAVKKWGLGQLMEAIGDVVNSSGHQSSNGPGNWSSQP